MTTTEKDMITSILTTRNIASNYCDDNEDDDDDDDDYEDLSDVEGTIGGNMTLRESETLRIVAKQQ